MNIKDFYESIGGDYEEALNRMMNDDIIYRMLLKFKSTNYLEAVEENYKIRNMKNVFECLHAFKGVAGNLAFKKLYEIVSDMTEKTRNLAADEFVNLDFEMQNLNDEYQKIINLIN